MRWSQNRNHLLQFLLWSIFLFQYATASAPCSRHGGKAFLSQDQKYVYILGGFDSDGNVLNDFWQLDLTKDFALSEPSWYKLPDMIYAVAYPGAVYINDTVYVIGGLLDEKEDKNCDQVPLVQSYHLSNNTWSASPTEGSPERRYMGGAFASNTTIYGFAGQSACNPSDTAKIMFNSMQKLLSDDNSWQTLSIENSPIAESGFGTYFDDVAAVFVGGEAPMTGGNRSYVEMSQWARFDLQSESWAYVPLVNSSQVQPRQYHLVLGRTSGNNEHENMLIIGGQVDNEPSSPGLISVTGTDSGYAVENMLNYTSGSNDSLPLLGLSGSMGVMTADGTALFGFGHFTDGKMAPARLFSYNVDKKEWAQKYSPTKSMQTFWTTNSKDVAKRKSSGLSKASIVALAVCLVAGLAILGALVGAACYWRRQKRRRIRQTFDSDKAFCVQKPQHHAISRFFAMFGLFSSPKSRERRLSRMPSLEAPVPMFGSQTVPKDLENSPQMQHRLDYYLPSWATAHIRSASPPLVPPHRIWPSDLGSCAQTPTRPERQKGSRSPLCQPGLHLNPFDDPTESDTADFNHRMVQVASMDRELSFTVPKMQLRVVNPSSPVLSSADLIDLQERSQAGDKQSSNKSPSTGSPRSTRSSRYTRGSIISRASTKSNKSVQSLRDLVSKQALSTQRNECHNPETTDTPLSAKLDTRSISDTEPNPFEDDNSSDPERLSSLGIEDTMEQVWLLMQQKRRSDAKGRP